MTRRDGTVDDACRGGSREPGGLVHAIAGRFRRVMGGTDDVVAADERLVFLV